MEVGGGMKSGEEEKRWEMKTKRREVDIRNENEEEERRTEGKGRRDIHKMDAP